MPVAAMMDFDEIWSQFSWVLEDMRNGMAFFEGYIPTLDENDLLASLQELIDRAEGHSFRSSTWSSDTTASDWDGEYSDAQYVAFFSSGRIYTLHFDYEVKVGGTPLSLKLMFDRHGRKVALEIVCYRDTILASPNPKRAIADAIAELRTLKQLFRGDALMLGPDTLERPASAIGYSKDWLRIE